MIDEKGNNGEQERCGHPDFYKLLEQMAALHSRKNHDYAGTKDPLKNLRSCERLNLKPFMGVMVRLQDKWSRLEEFVNSGQLMVKDESVIDTLMDNAVYSLLAIILYQEQQKELDDLEGAYGKPEQLYRWCPECRLKILKAKDGEMVPICGECSEGKFKIERDDMRDEFFISNGKQFLGWDTASQTAFIRDYAFNFGTETQALHCLSWYTQSL